MPHSMVLQEGEEPKDPGNFVTVEQIPAPRGAPRYRVSASGRDEKGPTHFDKTSDSLEIVQQWAIELSQTWTSQPPIYMRHPLA